MWILREAHQRSKLGCSVCTASVVLGRAGLLKGRRATTHHLRFDELVEYSEEVIAVHEKIVVDGKIVTGARISSSLDTSLTIVRLMLGEDVAHEVANRIDIAEIMQPPLRN
jgi:transcriptional regulator GlxA family with amidase domain